MKKILLYENRKVDPVAWDASTPELKKNAFLQLFRLLDEDWQLFTELADMQSKVYEDARNGDAQAARKVLNYHKGYEYCNWQMLEVN